MTSARSSGILVVEDEPAVADLLIALLRDEGYTAELARDGATAMRLIDQRCAAGEPFDLLLLDMMLPGVPGAAVLAHSRAKQAAAPILALSADRRALLEATVLGAAATLAKPFDVGDLLALVEHHYRPRQV